MPIAFATGGTLTGTGTADEPYQIFDIDDLKAFRDKVNGGETSACGKLMADIVLNPGTFDEEGVYTPASDESAEQWISIAAGDVSYSGTFDGDNHTISGLYIDSTDGSQGFFGSTNSSAVIKNLGIIDSFVSGGDYIGGVVGTAIESSVTNCYYSGVVCGNETVGSIAGYNSGSIINCHSDGAVSGSQYIGGIVGYSMGSLGDSDTEDYKLSYISNCYHKGAVSGDNYVGGAIGLNSFYSIVENTYHIGNVSATVGFAGGVVGVNDGNYPGHPDNGQVINTYHIGTVSGSDYIGGVVGFNYGDVTNSFYRLGDAENNDLGTAISEDDFAVQTTFTDWDFDTVWHINNELKRPILTAIPEIEENVELGFKSLSYEKTESGYDVTGVLTESVEDAVLVAAIYDENNRLISIDHTDIIDETQDTVSVSTTIQGTYIKVFLWDDIAKMTPLCESDETNIE